MRSLDVCLKICFWIILLRLTCKGALFNWFKKGKCLQINKPKFIYFCLLARPRGKLKVLGNCAMKNVCL